MPSREYRVTTIDYTANETIWEPISAARKFGSGGFLREQIIDDV